MRDTNILGKEQAFKIALVSEFNCQTFEEFVTALGDRMEHLSKVSDHLTVYGHDAYNKWFRFHVKSFRYQPLNNTIILTIYYKWETSSDKESNWHEEDLVIFSTTYAGYKRNADRIYRKNKEPDHGVDALTYAVQANAIRKENAVKPVDSSFEQWKKKNPLAYEIIFTLISYYGKKNGRDAKSEMYFIKQNFKDRIIGMDIGTDCAGIHCPKVNHFKIKDICTLSEFVRIELDDMTYTDSIGVTRKIDCTYTASIIKVEYSIIQKISSDVDAAYDEKCRTDKPTYKKPGVTYQHVSTAKPGSTETQKVIERMLKNSFYGTQVIGFNGKLYADTDEPWANTNPDLSRKVMEYAENDVKICMDYYKYLDEKENKEMKNEHKIIINHNAVIAIDGKYKSVVALKKGEKWNTKLGVVMALAKFTRKDLYEILCTIKNPREATVDCVADMLQMGSGNRRIKTFKWYQDAIKTERPTLGKQVSIDITYEEA